MWSFKDTPYHYRFSECAPDIRFLWDIWVKAIIASNNIMRVLMPAASCFGLLSILLLTSCSGEIQSPDGRYKAIKVGGGADVHYRIVELKKGRTILTTTAQYATPNDVKAGGFSPDSKRFAAIYHYEPEGTYTWVGVWSTETGQFLYPRLQSGLVSSLDGSFESPLPEPKSSATSIQSTESNTAFMKGVAYTSWRRGEYSSRQSDTTLSQVIKPMGVNWVALIVTCYQERTTSTTVQCKTDTLTPTDDDLTHAIQYAHSLGIKVMLKPHIDLSDDPNHWRGQIDFGNDEAAWGKWFDSYTDFLMRYAGIAQKTSADYFCNWNRACGHVASRRAVAGGGQDGTINIQRPYNIRCELGRGG